MLVMSKGILYDATLCIGCKMCEQACAEHNGLRYDDPVGAFHKTAEGPVVYDVWKCIGCRYCMVACAFAQPKYEWHSLNPRVRKCIMCPERVNAGQQTACAEVCPTGATKFGERDALI